MTYILCSADENHLKDNEAQLHAELTGPFKEARPFTARSWSEEDRAAWIEWKDAHGLRSSYLETVPGGHFPSTYVCGVCGAPMVSVERSA